MFKQIMTAGAVIALTVAGAEAQTTMPKNVISIQPLNAIFEVYSGEFERAAGKAATWGLGGTYSAIESDLEYSSTELKGRYYPAGIALQGFSVGGAVGFTRISSSNFDGTKDTAGGPSIAVLIEYQWLMGVKKNFSLVLGVGAKSLNVDEDEFTNSVTVRYPTGRLSIGIAF
jgi:hypothetical protein